jgi:hypothetical protein
MRNFIPCFRALLKFLRGTAKTVSPKPFPLSMWHEYCGNQIHSRQTCIPESGMFLEICKLLLIVQLSLVFEFFDATIFNFIEVYYFIIILLEKCTTL